MAASKRWLAVALLIIALSASLEYMPRNIIFQAAIPADAAFPLNEGPSGTSRLWQKLADLGYRQAIVYASSGLAGRLENITDVVFLLVAPDTPTGDATVATQRVLDTLLDSGRRVHVILLDEAPSREAYEFYRYAWTRICGGTPPLVSNRILNNTVATIVAVAGGKTWRLPTGYTGYISGPDGRAPYTSPAQPLLEETGQGTVYFAAAWPYPEPGAEGLWYLVGARCATGKGSVTVLADSTVAVNLAAVTSPEDLEFTVTLVRSVAPNPDSTLILVDEAFYAGGGGQEVNLVLRLHPSVLALAFAHVYRAVEREALQAFVERNIYWLIPAAVGLILLSSSWIATQASAKEVYEEKAEKARKRRWRVPKPLAGVVGSWSGAAAACREALEQAGIAPEWGPEPVRDHIRHHRGRLESTCRLVSKAPLPLRLIPLWGWAARRARDHARALLELAGLPPSMEGPVGEHVGGG